MAEKARSVSPEFFGTENVWKIMLRIAPPIMLAQLIQAHIVQIFFDIRPLYHIQNGKGKFSNLHFMAITVFLMEKFKEKSNIIGISQSCSGGSIRLNSTEKISAEAGERIQNLAEF